MPGASLVSLSIRGPYVKDEALSALRHNRHLFIFSDNVPIEDEVEIKREAQQAGIAVHGPGSGHRIPRWQRRWVSRTS